MYVPNWLFEYGSNILDKVLYLDNVLNSKFIYIIYVLICQTKFIRLDIEIEIKNYKILLGSLN